MSTAAAETVLRYERFLCALIDDGAGSPAFACLGATDALEWIAEQAGNVLDGSEAECPRCSTPIHEGACVGEDAPPAPAKCRVCGCTDIDCRGCIERTGKPCYWVEADLCSACRQATRSEQVLAEAREGDEAQIAMDRDPIKDPQVGDRVRAVWANPMFHEGNGTIQTVEAVCGNLIATTSTGEPGVVLWRPIAEWCKTDVWIDRWEAV